MSQPRLTCPFSRDTNRSGSTMLSREPSGAGPRLCAVPRSKPLRFGTQVRRSGSPQRHRFGWDCALCPSQVRAAQEFGECDLRLVAFSVSAAQLSGWTAGAPCEADGDCPAPPEVLAKKPACSLVSEVSPGLQLPLSSPYGSGCLSPAGDGLQPAFSIPSFVCAGSWQCLMFELFAW